MMRLKIIIKLFFLSVLFIIWNEFIYMIIIVIIVNFLCRLSKILLFCITLQWAAQNFLVAQRLIKFFLIILLIFRLRNFNSINLIQFHKLIFRNRPLVFQKIILWFSSIYILKFKFYFYFSIGFSFILLQVLFLLIKIIFCRLGVLLFRSYRRCYAVFFIHNNIVCWWMFDKIIVFLLRNHNSFKILI